MPWKHTKNHNKPASGMPASGIPARGVGVGDGWGGPVAGFTKSATFSADHQPDRSPEAMAERKLLKAEREARIAQLTEHLGDLALNAEREETQVSATVAALNRLEGMPKQKNENTNVEVTWEQMIAESLKPKKPE